MEQQKDTGPPPKRQKHRSSIGKVISVIGVPYRKAKWFKNLVERLPHFPMALVLVVIWSGLRLFNCSFMHMYLASIITAFAMMACLTIELGQALYARFSMRRYATDLFFSGLALSLMTGVLVLVIRNGYGLSLGDGFIFGLCWLDYLASPMIYLKSRAIVGTGFGGADHEMHQEVMVDSDAAQV
ncbi:hypothetical protein A3K73_02145 [Candidatus Pacearchaeota archaeon RBG_13_36_9]|nr:MAG: hypothetical protein A3K73_02145 [Candidatus Pacearchaeota archaeon RBG_13_36_9]